MFSCLPPLAHAIVGKEITHGALNLFPQLQIKYAFAPGVIHSFEVLEETILECAKSKFGDGIEAVERLNTAKIKRSELGAFMKCFGEITPLNRKSVHR